MKRLLVLLSIFVLFITGCSVVKLDEVSFEKNLDTLLSEKISLYNVNCEGYKYYLPKGLHILNKEDYNAIIKDEDNNLYYLYIDAISYYHKIQNTYEENDQSYFSKKLDYNHKNGYIQIDEVDSKYFIQFVYHYSKIETYVDKKDLSNVVVRMSSILRTVQFNDTILESLIGENVLDYKEEDYTLFKADSSKETFLDVVKKEETEQYKKDLEDEKISLDY